MGKRNKIGRYLTNRLHDVFSLSLNVGLVGVIDYVGGFNIDHPMQDIAFGAGLQAGFSNGKPSRLVSSIIAAGLSMYPNFSQLAFSGDVETFLKGAGAKVVSYGVGGVISTLINGWVMGRYDGMIEINALFKNEKEADQASEYLKGIVKLSDYIMDSGSSVDELKKTKKGYSLHVRIIGETPQIQRHLKSSLENYFSRTMKPLESKISDIIKIKRE